MKPKAKTLFLTAGLVTAILSLTPAQTQACECLDRLFEHLFCWWRQPRAVDPIVEPRLYYDTGCSTGVETGLGGEPAPAPAAEGPGSTFGNDVDSGSLKPAPEPEGGAAPAEKEPAPAVQEPPLPDVGTENPGNSAASEKPVNAEEQITWQPVSRKAARQLLRQRLQPTVKYAAVKPAVRPSHPEWIPVGKRTVGKLARR